ncbi:MAG TPA: DUF2461 domain-containing protein [Terriglobia bacterium]|jgi:uncharacterized protein (TIGR02453 family)
MTNRAFNAFPKEGLQFLRSLKRHNNREWFQEHKSIYEQHVKQPMEALIGALAAEFRRFAPEMMATPKVSAYRIYRDTRFSKDKSPYKTHVAASFPRSGLGKHDGSGFYLHIAPSEVFIGGGLYMPEPEDLARVRQRIADDPEAFFKVIRSKRFKNLFGEVTGDQLARIPRGFRADHPAADYLRHKNFLAARSFPAETAVSPQFFKLIVETFKGMAPFVRFLNEPILHARRLKQRQESLLL